MIPVDSDRLSDYVMDPKKTVFLHTTHITNLDGIFKMGALLPRDSLSKLYKGPISGSALIHRSSPEKEQGIFFYAGGYGEEAPDLYFVSGAPVAFLLPYDNAIKHAWVKGFRERSMWEGFRNQIIMRGKRRDGGIPLSATEMVHPEDIFYVRIGDRWLPALPSNSSKYDIVLLDNAADTPREGDLVVGGKTIHYVVGNPRAVPYLRRHSNPFVGVYLNEDYRGAVRDHIGSLSILVKDYLEALAHNVRADPQTARRLDDYVRSLAEAIWEQSSDPRIRELAKRIKNGEDPSIIEFLKNSYFSSRMDDFLERLKHLDKLSPEAKKLMLAHLLGHVASGILDSGPIGVYQLGEKHGVVDVIGSGNDPAEKFVDILLSIPYAYRAAIDQEKAIDTHYKRYLTVANLLKTAGMARGSKEHIISVLREKGVPPEDIADHGDHIDVKNADRYGAPRRIHFFGKGYRENLHEFLLRLARERGHVGPHIGGFEHAHGPIPMLPEYVGKMGKPAGKIRAYVGQEHVVYDVSPRDVALRRAEFFKRLEQSLEHEDPNIQPFIRAFLSAYRGEPTSPPDRSLSSRAVHAAVTHLAKTFAEMEKKHGREYALFKMEEILRNKRNAYLRAWFNGNIRPTTMMLARVADRLHREVLKEIQQNLAKQRVRTGQLDMRALSKGFVEGHYGE